MNYYGVHDIARGFRTVRKNTLQLAGEIPEAQYGFTPAPGTRSVAQTLVHVAMMPRLQLTIHKELHLSTLTGFDFFATVGALIGEEQHPRTKAEIVALLTDEGEQYASWLESLDDAFLGEFVEYPAGMVPARKSRFEMLISPKEHEMHHRGQLMLAQRLLGIVPHLTRQTLAMIAQRQNATA